MKWKKIEYMYKGHNREREFEEFKKNTGVDKMENFNFGYEIEEVFLGENPRYNPNKLEYEAMPDHTHFFYKNSKNGKIYLVGFPYVEVKMEMLKRFCNVYHISCAILPKYSSFYNDDTFMVVFAEHNDLKELLQKYEQRLEIIIDPDIDFYRYLTEYCKTKSPIEKDFIEDVKRDGRFPKNCSDLEMLKYLRYEAREVYDVYIRLRKKYKIWCQNNF